MRYLRAVALLIVISLAAVAAGDSAVSGSREEHLTPGEIYELENMLADLERSIEEGRRKISRLSAEISAAERRIEQTEAELQEAEVRLQDNIRLFGKRVRSAYIKGGVSYLELLLTADSFGELISRTVYLKSIITRDAQLIKGIKEERARIEQRKSSLEEEHRHLQDLMRQARQEQENLLAQRKAKEALLEQSVARMGGWKPVYGVVIDNHPQARPQAGLSQASVVYEYEVEGRITRYLALFAVLPAKVGPIRSARTHSAMLALENNVHYIYASGTEDVRGQLGPWGLRHTNALFSGSSSFYRDNSRRAPHNLYVNLLTLGLESPSKEVVVRPAFLEREGRPATIVSLQYNPNTRIEYRYNSQSRNYRRYLNGELQRDAQGNTITARNIIIQYAPHSLDFRGRPTPNLIGTGRIDYYAQGQHFQGTWRKDSVHEPTRFYYEDGREIKMVYGITWIQIVRN